MTSEAVKQTLVDVDREGRFALLSPFVKRASKYQVRLSRESPSFGCSKMFLDYVENIVSHHGALTMGGSSPGIKAMPPGLLC